MLSLIKKQDIVSEQTRKISAEKQTKIKILKGNLRAEKANISNKKLIIWAPLQTKWIPQQNGKRPLRYWSKLKDGEERNWKKLVLQWPLGKYKVT